MVLSLYWKIRIKILQILFCEKYLKKIESTPSYAFFLKRLGKEQRIKSYFFIVSLFDLIDNTGFNRLMHRIYKLKDRKGLKVETSYIYRRFRKLNYISSNIVGSRIGHIATITFLNDKWLRSIEISYTYVNNSQAIIQYQFSFKKAITSPLLRHQFVEDNIMYVKKETYFYTYLDLDLLDRADNKELYRLDDVLFSDILQAYICTLFTTKYGRYYNLPIEYICHLRKYNKKVRKRLRSVFLCAEYEKSNEYILISAHGDRYECNYFYVGKMIPNSIMFRLFSDFSSEMYYTAFSRIEIQELENRMRKYLNSSRSFVSASDIKWLVNKKRYIKEQEERIKNNLKEENKPYIQRTIDWKCYYRGKPEKRDLINYPDQTSYFLKLYEENLSYLDAISSVQNNKVLVLLSIATLVATIVGIIVQRVAN